MVRRTIEEKQKIRLAQKFDYIMDSNKIPNDNKFIGQSLGYADGRVIGLWRKYKNKYDIQNAILLMAQESLEKHFDIPLALWEYSLAFDTKKIDRLIEEYRENKEKAKKSTNNQSFESSKEKEVIFNRLKGVWYSYTYPSKPEIVKDGIWILKVMINDDYIITDEHGNYGKLHIRKQESYIEKLTKETGELILIRFPNYQIPYGIFLYSIQSNEIGTHGSRPMLNFGFYSRKLYQAEEAKNILGEIKKVQLKLDLGFNDRIIENYKY